MYVLKNKMLFKKKYILLSFVFFCIPTASLAGLDAFFYRGLDAFLQRATENKIPSYLLPSEHMQMIRRVESMLLLGKFQNVPFRSETGSYLIPLHPRSFSMNDDTCFPCDYETAFVQHLFPASSTFLFPNQLVSDPISSLTPRQLGSLVRVLNGAGKVPLSSENDSTLKQKCADILDLKLDDPLFRTEDEDVFNHQETKKAIVEAAKEVRELEHDDAPEAEAEAEIKDDDELQGVKNRYLWLFDTEEAFMETFLGNPTGIYHEISKRIASKLFNSEIPLTNAVRYQNINLYKAGFLTEGELEKLENVQKYSDEALKKLRLRRFLSLLTGTFRDQVESTNGSKNNSVQQILTTYFWKKAKDVQDILKFYGAATGSIISIRDFDFSANVIPSVDFVRLTDQISRSPEVFFGMSTEERQYVVWNEILRGSFIPLSFGSSQFKGRKFSDCAETAIRNVIMRCIRQVNETVFYVAAWLPENSPAQVFFQECRALEDHFASETHTRWNEYVSNISTVPYFKTHPNGERYEIKPGIFSFIHVMKHLLSISDDVLPPLAFTTSAQDLPKIQSSLAILSRLLSGPQKDRVRLSLSRQETSEGKKDDDDLSSRPTLRDYIGTIFLNVEGTLVAEVEFDMKHVDFKPIAKHTNEGLGHKIITSQALTPENVGTVSLLVRTKEDINTVLPHVDSSDLSRFLREIDSSLLGAKLEILKISLTANTDSCESFVSPLLQKIIALDDGHTMLMTWNTLLSLLPSTAAINDPLERSKKIDRLKNGFLCLLPNGDCYVQYGLAFALKHNMEELVDFFSSRTKLTTLPLFVDNEQFPVELVLQRSSRFKPSYAIDLSIYSESDWDAVIPFIAASQYKKISCDFPYDSTVEENIRALLLQQPLRLIEVLPDSVKKFEFKNSHCGREGILKLAEQCLTKHPLISFKCTEEMEQADIDYIEINLASKGISAGRFRAPLRQTLSDEADEGN